MPNLIIQKILIILLYALFGISAVTQAAGQRQDLPTTSNDNPTLILEELRALPPLPKVHYSWGFPVEFFDEKHGSLAYEFVRISHSISVNASPNQNQLRFKSRLDNAVYTCARINKTEPNIPCSIAICYSPWHYRFVMGAKLTDRKYDHHIFLDSTYQTEINEFIRQMTFVKERVNASNHHYGSNVKVSAVLLNGERFSPRKKDPDWNKAVAKALDDIHAEALKVFPDARIEWYLRGKSGHYVGKLSKWYSYFTGLEKYIPSLSYTNYVVPNTELTTEIFLKTCELGDSLGVQDITPWIGLAWGRQRNILGKLEYKAWDYDVKFSYQAGVELNDFCKGLRPETYPPYDRVKVVILYTPFADDIPAFGEHFIEYCKGAVQANRQ